MRMSVEELLQTALDRAKKGSKYLKVEAVEQQIRSHAMANHISTRARNRMLGINLPTDKPAPPVVIEIDLEHCKSCGEPFEKTRANQVNCEKCIKANRR